MKSPPVKSTTAFRTISEVSGDLDVPQHVLRFWETKFPQIRPLKRGGGRRYYRPEDVDLLRRIQSLLYREGYTIKGVQRLLKESRGAMPPTPAPLPAAEESDDVPAMPDLFADDPPDAALPDADEPALALPDVELPDPELPDCELPDTARREIEAVIDELRDLRVLLAVRRP